jgi:ketosteroid isomerase-like protein
MSATARFGLAALLVLSAACQSMPSKTSSTEAGSAAPAGLSAADEAAVRGADSAFARAATAGDGAAVGALYAPDATIMPPADSSRHGAAVAQYWSGFLSAFTVSLTLSTTTVDGRGDLAFATGTYTLAATPKQVGAKPMPTDNGKYLEIMKKQPDGSWKILYDMWNANTAPAKP